jgi:hypothetical protein
MKWGLDFSNAERLNKLDRGTGASLTRLPTPPARSDSHRLLDWPGQGHERGERDDRRHEREQGDVPDPPHAGPLVGGVLVLAED